MKYFSLNISKSKGFTLIELLVVISIISLLSSVVLASVKEAREKAKARAFRTEIIQFVNALELYRADNGYYPGQNLSGFIYYKNSNGISYTEIDAEINNIQTLESFLINRYIPKIPTPFVSGTELGYLASGYKCWGDVSVPEYIILISSSVPGFEDWKFVDNSGEEGSGQRCFSLK